MLGEHMSTIVKMEMREFSFLWKRNVSKLLPSTSIINRIVVHLLNSRTILIIPSELEVFSRFKLFSCFRMRNSYTNSWQVTMKESF